MGGVVGSELTPGRARVEISCRDLLPPWETRTKALRFSQRWRQRPSLGGRAAPPSWALAELSRTWQFYCPAFTPRYSFPAWRACEAPEL
jgi:hypothetical protein